MRSAEKQLLQDRQHPQSERVSRLYYVQCGAWIALIDTFDHWERLYSRLARRQDVRQSAGAKAGSPEVLVQRALE